jgi:AAA domain
MRRSPEEALEQIGVHPLPRAETLAERGNGAIDEPREPRPASDGNGGDPEPPIVKATPFVWVDPTKIPLRRWLYGGHYQRQFLSQTVGLSGIGKTFLGMAEALAIITGRALLGVKPDEQTNVWYWGEDPMDELQRRFTAAALHYQIDPKEIAGHLFLDSGRTTKIVIAEQTKTGAKIVRPVVDALIATIKANDIGVMIVDPFISSHSVIENDNVQIDVAASGWAEVVETTDCAADLIHHSRKTGGAEVTVEDGRGASSLGAKVRAMRTLNVMSEDEAAKSGVKERRAYFRVDNGKTNNSPPSSVADWYQLLSHDLPNGDDDKPGDSVGVVAKWTWPDPFEGVTVTDLRKAQAAIAVGGPWRESLQSKDWAGNAVPKALGLDPTNKAHRVKVSGLLKTWTAKGLFKIVEGEDSKRMKRNFIEVGEPADD